MVNKDVTHPKMRRRIENPRIVLLDCPMEYKKGESQTNVELQNEGQWERLLEIEEEQIRDLCENIIRVKPDLVITEKGVSDLAQHYLLKADITAIRRIKKTDNHRVARATGATIVNRVEDLKESDVGTKCGLFEINKIGDEYFMYLTKCQEPKVRARFGGRTLVRELTKPHTLTGLHHRPPRPFQGHHQRSRTQPPRRHGRRPQRHL